MAIFQSPSLIRFITLFYLINFFSILVSLASLVPTERLPQFISEPQLASSPYKYVGLFYFEGAELDYVSTATVVAHSQVLVTCVQNFFDIEACVPRPGTAKFFPAFNESTMTGETLKTKGIPVRKYIYDSSNKGFAALCPQRTDSCNSDYAFKDADVACVLSYEKFSKDDTFLPVCACPTAPKTLLSSAPKWSAGYMDLTAFYSEQFAQENAYKIFVSTATTRPFVAVPYYTNVARMTTRLADIKNPLEPSHLITSMQSAGSPIFIQSDTGEIKVAAIVIAYDNNEEAIQNATGNMDEINLNTEIYILNPAFKQNILVPALESLRHKEEL